MGAATLPDSSVRARDFEAFYREHRERLYRALALTLRNPSLAAEAVDEAFTRALERWAKIGRYERPEAWVYRVGFNWATSRFRRLRREAAGLFEHPAIADAVPDPALTQAVDELPPHQRAVVVLRLYADWSTEAVAEALGVPPGTVKSRLSRALEALAARPEVTP